MTPFPRTTALFRELQKRRAVTERSSQGLSLYAIQRIESGETPRRDVVMLLRAREDAIQRSEPKPKRKRARRRRAA